VRGASDSDVHDEIDGHGRGVLRDACLMQDRHDSFSQIDAAWLVAPWNDYDDARTLFRLGLSEPEVHDPLILLDDFQRGKEENEDEDEENERAHRGAHHVHALKGSHRAEIEKTQDSPHTNPRPWMPHP